MHAWYLWVWVRRWRRRRLCLMSGWRSMSGGGGGGSGRRRHRAKPSLVLDDLKDVEQHLALLLSEVAVDKLQTDQTVSKLATFNM